MTKDEFLSMLSSELENLEQECQTASQRVEYFGAINSQGKEYQDAEIQLKIVKQKIRALSRLVTLPTYARIQAMSDAEIEEYKKAKIDDLELKIKEIEYREEQEKTKLSELKATQEELMVQFGSLTGFERERVILRGREISEEINKYDVNNSYGVFGILKRELEEIKREQEQIRAMTSQEIKQQLTSEVKGNQDLAQTIEWSKNPIDASTELEASVASDPEKSQQMAYLLTQYRGLSDEQSQIKSTLYLSFYNVPSALKFRLSEHYDERSLEVSDPDKLIEIIEKFESDFGQVKAMFMEQFTEQKLSKLVGKDYGITSSEDSQIDINFLKQHTDKLGVGELDYLQSLVEQKNKLNNKIFKTKDTKSKIEELCIQIMEEASKIYYKIINWYEYRNKTNILGTNGVRFYDIERLRESLERCREDISKSEQSISELKEKIRTIKAEIERQKQNYETRKNEVAEQIRALGGEKYKETEMPYASDRFNYNLDNIASAHNQVYNKEIVDRVQQEAQNQADIREAELRGVTVEQLLQMRQQEQAMGYEPVLQIADEDNSIGMNR